MSGISVQGKLSLDGSGWDATLRKAGEGVEHLGGEQLQGLKRAAMEAFSIGAISELIRGTVEYGSEIEHASKRLGVSTDSVQQLGYAARQAGSELSTVETGMDRLSKALQTAMEGGAAGDKMSAALQRLGLSVEDFSSQNAEEPFRKIGVALEGVESNAQTTADMMQVFGRGAGQLIPILKELREKSEEISKNGLLLNQSDIDSLHEAEQSFDRLSTKLKVMTGDAIEFWQEFGHSKAVQQLFPTEAQASMQRADDQKTESKEEIVNYASATRKYLKSIHNPVESKPRELTEKEQTAQQNEINRLNKDTQSRRDKREEEAGTVEQRIAREEKNQKELKDALVKPHSALADADLKNQVEVSKDKLRSLYKDHMNEISKKEKHGHGSLPEAASSLVKTGNFLGVNAGAIPAIGERTNQILVQIHGVLINIAKNSGGGALVASPPGTAGFAP